MRPNKISVQFRNPFHVKGNSKFMEIMSAYRQACESDQANITFSDMKGGKTLSTTLPEAWIEDMRVWSRKYRNTFGKAFIDACEWWIKGGGVI